MENNDKDQTNPKPENPEENKQDTIFDLDEVEIASLEVTRRIRLDKQAPEIDDREKLKAEAQVIQDRYEKWIIKKVLDHFKIKKEYLIFMPNYPLLMADRTKIFFGLAYTNTGTEFLVIGDLDKQGNITEFRIDILEE